MQSVVGSLSRVSFNFKKKSSAWILFFIIGLFLVRRDQNILLILSSLEFEIVIGYFLLADAMVSLVCAEQ